MPGVARSVQDGLGRSSEVSWKRLLRPPPRAAEGGLLLHLGLSLRVRPGGGGWG